MNKILIITGCLLTTFGVMAKLQTVTLEVPTMNCPTCPITVTKSLENLNGVTDVEVTFEQRLTQVSYDDKITNTKALIDATTNAGYPSYLKE